MRTRARHLRQARHAEVRFGVEGLRDGARGQKGL